MMFGHDFYHGSLRRYVIMFGNLFNELQVDRHDSTGAKIQTLNVPIEYGPKQKFITRVLSDPTLNREISITLPRLGFEFTSMSYAPQRKLNSAHKMTTGVNTGGTDFGYVYTPVPYDFNFSLHVLVKNTEDGTQIVEQIVPFFTPDFTVTMKMVPELGINMDIPIELISINSDDSYEGDFDSRRVQTWQLDFVVKGYLFGPVNKHKFIVTADLNLIDNSASANKNIESTQTVTGNSEFGTTETQTNNNGYTP
jgi:hypothetical protein